MNKCSLWRRKTPKIDGVRLCKPRSGIVVDKEEHKKSGHIAFRDQCDGSCGACVCLNFEVNVCGYIWRLDGCNVGVVRLQCKRVDVSV